MAKKTIIKTFPLTVTQEWLDEVEKHRVKNESKHDFILKAVQNEVKNRKQGISIIREGN